MLHAVMHWLKGNSPWSVRAKLLFFLGLNRARAVVSSLRGFYARVQSTRATDGLPNCDFISISFSVALISCQDDDKSRGSDDEFEQRASTALTFTLNLPIPLFFLRSITTLLMNVCSEM
jgi:hypothetical protein